MFILLLWLSDACRTVRHGRDGAVLWRHANHDDTSSAGEQTGDALHMCMRQCECM